MIDYISLQAMEVCETCGAFLIVGDAVQAPVYKVNILLR